MDDNMSLINSSSFLNLYSITVPSTISRRYPLRSNPFQVNINNNIKGYIESTSNSCERVISNMLLKIEIDQTNHYHVSLWQHIDSPRQDILVAHGSISINDGLLSPVMYLTLSNILDTVSLRKNYKKSSSHPHPDPPSKLPTSSIRILNPPKTQLVLYFVDEEGKSVTVTNALNQCNATKKVYIQFGQSNYTTHDHVFGMCFDSSFAGLNGLYTMCYYHVINAYSILSPPLSLTDAQSYIACPLNLHIIMGNVQTTPGIIVSPFSPPTYPSTYPPSIIHLPLFLEDHLSFEDSQGELLLPKNIHFSGRFNVENIQKLNFSTAPSSVLSAISSLVDPLPPSVTLFSIRSFTYTGTSTSSSKETFSLSPKNRYGLPKESLIHSAYVLFFPSWDIFLVLLFISSPIDAYLYSSETVPDASTISTISTISTTPYFLVLG